MSTSSRQRPPSATSLNHSTSLRSFRRPPPPATIVVTSPPWARDEPPSPTEHLAPSTDGPHLTETRISDVTSFHSRHPSDGTSRWWSFTRTRPRQDTFNLIPPSPKTERKSFRDISLSWMPTSATPREPGFLRKEKERESDPSPTPHLSIPIPSQPPHTLAHNNTPGWDTPWTSRPAAQGPTRQSRDDDEESYGFREDNQSDSSHKNLSGWALRRRKLRSFILVNTYVPLLFRFINIAFTTAALGISIRIRNLELDHNALGAVGSSPTVVIIFAPLTLIHVMVAIYLEYFGRPLGLWRTSAKLAHTLSEVLFICAWSAALSLCFDNFFTSLIPCASASSSSWYNKLPRPNYNIPNFEGSVGDDICDQQLALICLVGVGLIAYCSNLVISLYRVFEKPKAARIRHGRHNSSVKLPQSSQAAVDETQSLKISETETQISEPLLSQSEPDGPEVTIQQSKKVKQIEKREAFLQKFGLSVTQGSKSHQRRMKRKAKEQLTGGLSDLQSALVTLEKDALAQQEPLNTIGASQDETKTEPAVKPRTIGKGGTSTLSKAQRKRVLKLERLRHPLILTNSEFSANPFQTIRTHAQNTLLIHGTKGKS